MRRSRKRLPPLRASPREAPARGATRCALILGVLTLGAGCAEAQRVTVHFAGEPDDALVTVDDQYVGKLGRLERGGVGLRPGTHRVTIEQVGYFPQDVLVEVAAEGPEPQVEVHLEPIPD